MFFALMTFRGTLLTIISPRRFHTFSVFCHPELINRYFFQQKDYLGSIMVIFFVFLLKSLGRRRRQRQRRQRGRGGGNKKNCFAKKAISPFFDVSGNKNIGNTIRIGREIWCLPYAGLFSTVSVLHRHSKKTNGRSCRDPCGVKWNTLMYTKICRRLLWGRGWRPWCRGGHEEEGREGGGQETEEQGAATILDTGKMYSILLQYYVLINK